MMKLSDDERAVIRSEISKGDAGRVSVQVVQALLDDSEAAATVRRIHASTIVELLRTLPEEERCEIFRQFCIACGKDDPMCYCTRDD